MLEYVVYVVYVYVLCFFFFSRRRCDDYDGILGGIL
jgi:hypothetical protein